MTSLPIKISRCVVGVFALLTLIALAAQLANSQLSSPDPLQQQSCNQCHLATNTTQNPKLLLRAQTQLCAGCHPKAIEVSHPSDIKPKAPMPEQFPLDWKGDLSCSSCHHIHQPAHGRLRSEERGKPFCTSCHQQTFFTNMLDQGESLIISGHMDNGALPGDNYSVQCMGCHDDKANGQGPYAGVIDNGFIRHTGGTNHPIGINYQQASRYGGYRPIEQLPLAVILPDGLVSCVSCHTGYSSDHGKLAVTTSASSLCFQCHDI